MGNLSIHIVGVCLWLQANKRIRLKRWKLRLHVRPHTDNMLILPRREQANVYNFVGYYKLFIEFARTRVSANMPDLHNWSSRSCWVSDSMRKIYLSGEEKMLRRHMKKGIAGIKYKNCTPNFHTEWLRHQSMETKLRKSPQTGEHQLVFSYHGTLANTCTSSEMQFQITELWLTLSAEA